MSDIKLQRLRHEIFSSGGGDQQLISELMAAILRNSLYQPILKTNTFPEFTVPDWRQREVRMLGGQDCFVFSQAIGAGVRLAEWSIPKGIPMLIRPELELLCPEESRHEMLRIFASYPGIHSGAQIVAFSPQGYEGVAGSAGIIYVNFPFSPEQGPTINFSSDYYSLVTNFWLKELCRRSDQGEIVREAKATYRNYLITAADLLSQRGSYLDINNIATSTLRYLYNLPAPCIQAPTPDSTMSPEQQENFCQVITSYITAGIKLGDWLFSSPHSYPQNLISGWEIGTIMDSPYARERGAAGAIPVMWDMVGGEIVDTPNRKYHRGGEAAIAYCGSNGGGFISGPADQLLQDKLRWSTAVSFGHDYSWP